MSRAQSTSRRFSIEEYLRMELEAEEKHEFHDGQIVAMSGGSYSQSLIIVNIVGHLRQQLRGGPCRVLESNLRLRVPRQGRYFYPDAMIVCGKPLFDPQDANQHSIINPKVVFEVLSPSTEGFDRGRKFDFYRMLESMEEYVLVSSSSPHIETFHRRDDGTWTFSPFAGAEATALLRSVPASLPLKEVYAEVEFPPVPVEADEGHN